MQTTLAVSEISVDDKANFDRYLELADLQVSELNFTNFFMWRDYYKIRYCIVNNFLCIISVRGEDKPFCFFPVGNYDNMDELKNALATLADYFAQMDWDFILARVSKEQLAVLERLGVQFMAQEDRDNFDYIYSVKKLSTLSGKKLDGKRNHINKFKKLYTFEYEEISENNLEECRDILERWCVERNFYQDNSLIFERRANLELLANFKILGLRGAIIKVNGKPEAFTVGEKLNSNTVVVHVEKANSEIQGLYPLINQQFLVNQWSDVEYVNREQDLGVEGLRKAKLSYNPVAFVEKYTVRLC